MILKQRPEDFRVWEDSSLPVGDNGPYGAYLLTKRSLTTDEALRRASRALCLPYYLFRFAGLKDRRAVSEQVVTVRSPRDCSGEWDGLAMRYIGRSSRPVAPGDIRRNRFEVVVRDLGPSQADNLQARAQAIGEPGAGFANYFDDQRFGGIREGGRFAGESLVRRDWDDALWFLLAAPGPRDTAREAQRRRLLRDRWGDWQACRELAADHRERAAYRALCRDGRAFRLAVNLLPRDLLAIHLAAWQSYWWNEVLRVFCTAGAGAAKAGDGGVEAGDGGVERGGEGGRGGQGGSQDCGPVRRRLLRYPGLAGEYLFLDGAPVGSGRSYGDGPRGILPRTIPALGRGVDWAGRREVEAVYRRVLALRDLRPEDFVLRGLPKVGLRSFARPAVVVPEGFVCRPARPDELHPGRARLSLAFCLPPGSYATMLIKAAAAVPGGPAG